MATQNVILTAAVVTFVQDFKRKYNSSALLQWSLNVEIELCCTVVVGKDLGEEDHSYRYAVTLAFVDHDLVTCVFCLSSTVWYE